VIIGMHHDQDIRNMGGLWKYMPVTWFTSLIGSLALIGTPLFAGFYSKDSIIEAAHAAQETGLAGATFAYWSVLIGVFVTAFYSFRMYFLVFHGKERFGQAHVHADDENHNHGHDAGAEPDPHAHEPHGPPHESPAVVTIPLILLAIPSAVIGFVAIDRFLFGDFLTNAIFVDAAKHPAMKELAEGFHGAGAMALHGLTTAPFWLALAGVVAAGVFYLLKPEIPDKIAQTFAPLYRLLDNKYYMDKINEWVFARGARKVGVGLWRGGDMALIDGVAVNGSARLVGWIAAVIRQIQSGYIYHYAFAMLLGVGIVLFFFLTLPYVLGGR
jgi:NADH-quinone oxidoreductase subunit L